MKRDELKDRLGILLGFYPKDKFSTLAVTKQSSISMQQAITLLISQINTDDLTDEELLLAVKGIVFACLDVISDDVAQAEYRLYRKVNGEKVEVKEHPMYDLLDDPLRERDGFNDFGMSRFDLFKMIMMQQMIWGRGFIHVTTGDRFREPAMLFPLDPRRMETIPGKRIVDHYEYTNYDGGIINYPAREIFHYRNVSPDIEKFFKGLSIVNAARWEIQTLDSIQNALYNTFEKGGVPEVWLFAKDVSEKDMKATGETLRTQYINNRPDRKRVPILTGDYTLQTLNLNNKELDTLNIIKDLQETIFAIFRVPPSKLGLRESVSQADAEEQDRTFKRDVIRPKTTALAGQINLDFMPLWRDSSNLYFEFINVVPEDVDRNVTHSVSLYQAGIATLNEARKINNLPENPEYETFYVPPQSAAFPSFITESSEPSQTRISDFRIKELPGSSFKNNGRDDRAFWNGGMLEQFKNWQSDWMTPLNNYFDGFESRINANLAQIEKHHKRLTIVKFSESDIDGVLTSPESEREILLRFTEGVAKDYFKDSADKASEILANATGRAPIAFNVADPNVTAWFNESTREEGAFRFTWEVEDTAFGDLREFFVNAATEGQPITEIARGVEDLFAGYREAEGWKSLRIAQTEMMRGFNQAGIQSGMQTAASIGALSKKFWYSAFLPTSRQSHMDNDKYSRERNGLDVDEFFPYHEGRKQMKHPGDGDAADDCNCHCASGIEMQIPEEAI